MVGIGEGEHCLLFTVAGWERLTGKAADILGDYHQRFPTRSGMPKMELGGRLKVGSYAPAALAKLTSQGAMVEESGYFHLPSHTVRLTKEQQSKIDAFLKALTQNPYSPPGELIPEPDLLNLLIEKRQVVKVSDSVVFAASAYEDMVARVKAHIKARGKVSLAEVRDMFRTSRKYAQALLEHLDGEKITRRVGDERVLY
jgi:selenocysteine-specific elongation factor